MDQIYSDWHDTNIELKLYTSLPNSLSMLLRKYSRFLNVCALLENCAVMHLCLLDLFFKTSVKMVFMRGLWETLYTSCAGHARLLRSAVNYWRNFTEDLKNSAGPMKTWNHVRFSSAAAALDFSNEYFPPVVAARLLVFLKGLRLGRHKWIAA